MFKLKKNHMESTVQKLEGDKIKLIFKEAEVVDKLHTVLTSKRGGYFRMKVISLLRNPHDIEELRKLKEEMGLKDLRRHINQLLEFNLIEEKKTSDKTEMVFTRTELGEKAVNALRSFQRKVGDEDMRKIFNAELGISSIRLFLSVYSHRKKVEFSKDTHKFNIKFSPLEIGNIARFLPRTLESVAAIDKLDDAGLLVYNKDGYIYMPPVKARSFYQYLRRLYNIIEGLDKDE